MPAGLNRRLRAAAACTAVMAIACHADPPPHDDGRPAIRVGATVFTAEDLAARERIVRWKYPEADNPRLYAAAQLIQGALLSFALASLGHPITEAELGAEIARIDADTHDAQGLAALKALCGGDKSDVYRRIAILPDFANRRYYFKVYPEHESLHAPRRQKAQQTLAALRAKKQGADLRAVATADGEWQFASQLFSVVRGFYQPGERAPAPGPENAPRHVRDALQVNDSVWAEYERDLFSRTPEGEVADRVISLPEGFSLIRWTGFEDRAAGIRRVERLWLPKRPAEDVLWEIAGKVEVELGDRNLQALLVQRISWMQRVRL